MDKNLEYLEKFQEVAQKSPGPVPFSFSFYRPLGSPAKKPRHLLIGICTHGNEVGSLPPTIEFMERILSGEITANFRVTIFVGNPEAVKINKRFVEEDLNRVYSHLDRPTLESKRAQELAPVIASSDLFIDLHQTIGPTLCPFFIFRFDAKSYHWARAFGGATEFITRPPKSSEISDTLNQNEFAIQQGIPSFTLELGTKGYNQSSIHLAEKTLKKAIELFQKTETRTIEELAKERPPLSVFEICDQQPFKTPAYRLKDGFKNLQAVKKGESLGFMEDKTLMLAKEDGVILFPKYPPRDENQNAIGPLPHMIYELARVITKDPEVYFSL
jgi:succinylglutamate desuccinylase